MKPSILPNVEEHLILLQEKKKQRRQLESHDVKQVELERKEKGFSLYVNGANAGGAARTARPQSSVNHAAAALFTGAEQESSVVKNRAKTAPSSRVQRRQWQVASVDLKTYTGDHIKIRPPVAATGNYADDFEDELSDVDSIEEEQYDSEDGGSSSVEEEISVEQSVENVKESKVMRSLQTCSPNDVKKLRESLQMSTNINNSQCTFPTAVEIDSECCKSPPLSECCQFSPDENVNKLLQKILQLDSRSQQRILHELSQKDDSPRRSTAWVDKTEETSMLPDSVGNRLPASASMSKISTETGVDISTGSSKIAASSSMSRLAADVSSRVPSGEADVVGSKGSADVCGRLASMQMDDVTGSSGSRTRESTDRLTRSRRQHQIQSDVQQQQQQQQQQSVCDDSIESTGRCEVRIEVLSNWGNTQRVGLTELELYDDCQQKIQLTADCVTISTPQQSSVASDVQCLFNGKYKTVKERYMWSCDVSCLPIVFALCPPRRNISFLRIWNYNHTLNDLSIGVRHVKISVNRHVVFDGEINKGCANQIFDYDQTVSLLRTLVAPSSDSLPVQSVLTSGDLKRRSRQSVAASNRDSVATSCDSYQSSVCYSSDLLSVAPPTNSGRNCPSRSPAASVCASTDSLSQVASCDLSTSQSVSSGARHRRRHKLQPQVAVSSELSPVRGPAESGQLADSKEPASSQVQRSANVSVSESAVRTNGAELSVVSVTQQSRQTSVSGVSEPVSVNQSVSEFAGETVKPPVFNSITNSGTVRPSSKSNVTNTDLPSWLDRSTVQSNEDQSKKTNDTEDYENLLENWPRPAGLSRLPTLLDVLDSTGCSTGSIQEEDEIPPMKHIESALKRKRQNFSLEQSWTSLDLFNRCQKGRISFDIQDDILDDYLPVTDRQKSEPVYSSTDQSAASSATTVTIETTQNTDKTHQQLAEEFVIPELPYGQEMVINIHTTWGDRHYVGLNGIELFAKTGQQVAVAKISADPSDINILPGYTCDPRVVGNLVDGTNRTQDDTHMWLAPFTPGHNHFIYITFEQPTCISMMRIWNYNKSRIHSSRGAKDITVTLDGVRIFVGEIARACGMMIGTIDSFGDTILFTTDEEILEQVAQFDESLDVDVFDSLNELDDDSERPGTADGTDSSDQTDQRPTTSAAYLSTDDTQNHVDDVVFQAQDVILNLLSTWGDVHYIGLTGLELVGPDSETVPLTLDMVDAQPRDLHNLPGHEDDDRTLDKLIDGSNITTSDEHMWLIPFVDGNNHTISIHLPQRTPLSGLRVWNYNKSSDDTFRGVRSMQVCLDGECVSADEGFLVRKGPGNCYFDFAQFISFSQHSTTHVTPNKLDIHSLGCENAADCDYVLRPCGFIYQLQLLSSAADPYYIGLNGLEFYHRNGQQIQLTETNIAAYPDSVNVLADVANDIRTPDKLVDGVNDTVDGRHMWLAPVLPNIVNRVYVLFDEPVELSAIKIWNYSKTSSRGVKDIALLVDDLLVYNGTMAPSTDRTAAVHTVVFTDSLDTAQRDRNTGTRDIEEQQVDLMNDRKIISSHNNNSQQRKNVVDQALRPKTSLPHRHK